MEKLVSKDLIELIKTKGLVAIEDMYLDWREDFLTFSKKYNSTHEEAMDAFQDAMIILFENVRDGKLNHLTSTLKTYVFSVGKYTLINKLKQANRVVELEKIPPQNIDYQSLAEDNLSEKQKKISILINRLGSQCRRIVLLFYYEKRSIKEIVKITGLKNENTVKAHKSRCLKTLKKLIK